MTCAFAALNGHLDCLAYAHDRDCPWDEMTCANAAKNGHLDCLVYAHEHGCPWDERTCAIAAMYGHLDCLAYAHEQGCPWDEGTCAYAAKNGHLDCLVYATHRGASWKSVSARDKERYISRWHALRVVARWTLRVRRNTVVRRAKTIQRVWKEYTYAPFPGRAGYERAKGAFGAAAVDRRT